MEQVLIAQIVDFDVERTITQARDLNPAVEVVRLSARTGEGLDFWYDWIRRRLVEAGERAFA